MNGGSSVRPKAPAAACGEDSIIGLTDNGGQRRLEVHQEILRPLRAIESRVRRSPTFHYLLARLHERRGEMNEAAVAYLTCIEQAGIPTSEYVCRVCGSNESSRQVHCDACGTWNSIDLDLDEDRLSASDLGLRERPVWTAWQEKSSSTD